MRRFLCWIGWHKWTMSLWPSKRKFYCKRCGKFCVGAGDAGGPLLVAPITSVEIATTSNQSRKRSYIGEPGWARR
jgi:hypothetical protein